jgi:hypothetical protein
MIPVNMRPLVRSDMKSAESFEFRRDSAGMGIPRGTMGKLDGVSRQTLSHGTATTPIFVTAPGREGPMAGRQGSLGTSETLGASVHRGMPPPRLGDESQRSIYDGSSLGAGGSGVSNGTVRPGGNPQPINSRGPSGGSSGPSGGSPSRPK